MKQLKVLMLGGARRVSMAELLKKSGERLGYEVRILSYELEREVPIAVAGRVIVGLKWSDPGVVDDIARICRENVVNIILPFVDGAIEIASACRKVLPEVFIPVSEFTIAQKMFDKVEAAKAFKQMKLPIPKTYSVINAKIPAIAKPRHGSASRGIKVFTNLEELMHLENLSDYLVQEYIEHNREYTVDCYVSQQGETLVAVPRRRIEVMGGEVTRTETFHNEHLEKLSREVIKAFGFIGPVTLQFLYDKDTDRYLLMEINPRLGGGVICSIYAGAPITDYILQEALGVEVKPCDDWTDHTLMTRYWKEMIFYNNHAKSTNNS